MELAWDGVVKACWEKVVGLNGENWVLGAVMFPLFV